MAKKEKNAKEFDPGEAQKRMEKYIKACESEKKGKKLTLSILGGSLLIFAILLVVILKMSGVGKTIVYEQGAVATSAYTESATESTELTDSASENLT